MNKIFLLIVLSSFIHTNTNMYWDLGVAGMPYSNKFNTTKSIDLSTFHRIEGLKKYATELTSYSISIVNLSMESRFFILEYLTSVMLFSIKEGS